MILVLMARKKRMKVVWLGEVFEVKKAALKRFSSDDFSSFFNVNSKTSDGYVILSKLFVFIKLDQPNLGYGLFIFC